MSLQERIYSVLLVSSSEKFNGAVSELLPLNRYLVTGASGVIAAKRVLAERDFDFIIVNSPLSDGDGIRFSIDAGFGRNTVVLLLVQSARYADCFDKAAGFGVFMLSKPVSRQSMLLALDWLTSARERLRQTEKKVLSVEEKIDEIRLVNRAKWLLISELKMTEPDAHRYIEKQAMDRCVQKRRIAEEIIKTYG